MDGLVTHSKHRTDAEREGDGAERPEPEVMFKAEAHHQSSTHEEPKLYAETRYAGPAPALDQ